MIFFLLDLQAKSVTQVVIFVNASKNTFSIQQSVILQFYCFIASINLKQQ